VSYLIPVPGLGLMEAPDPHGLATAADDEVLKHLITPHGCVDPVAIQILIDRGLCVRGDHVEDIERKIAARKLKKGH